MHPVAVKDDPRSPDRSDAAKSEHQADGEQPKGRAVGRWVWEWAKSILIVLLLFVVIRSFLVEAFRIPTGSMQDTLLVGDFLLVNKAVFGGHIPFTHSRLPGFGKPERDEIIVFAPPHEPDRNYVKRLVGLPGDTLAMRDKILYIEGRPQQEPYARHNSAPDLEVADMLWQCQYRPPDAPSVSCHPTRDNWGPLVVPAGHYFMLGDNRDDSEDSRYWGFVSRTAIEGKPLAVYYSYNPESLRPLPWLTQIRWSRIGRTVH